MIPLKDKSFSEGPPNSHRETKKKMPVCNDKFIFFQLQQIYTLQKSKIGAGKAEFSLRENTSKAALFFLMFRKQQTYAFCIFFFWQALSAEVLSNQNDIFHIFESTSVHTFIIKMLFLEKQITPSHAHSQSVFFWATPSTPHKAEGLTDDSVSNPKAAVASKVCLQ